eukprot:m.89530 g.89530  ORF g.89530 m.89530 type:complete len:304 (+) comp8417_c0_seq1:67-978(+)
MAASVLRLLGTPCTALRTLTTGIARRAAQSPLSIELQTREVVGANGRGSRVYCGENGTGDFPSVTTILSKTRESVYALTQWENKRVLLMGREQHEEEQAAIRLRGSRFHELVERYLLQGPQAITEEALADDTGIRNLWASIAPRLPDFSNVAVIESAVVHPTERYAGTVDCVARYRDVLCVIDWKTASSHKKRKSDVSEYQLQMAAYRAAIQNDPRYRHLHNVPIEGVLAIAYADGSPATIFHFTESECLRKYAVFARRLERYRSMPAAAGEAVDQARRAISLTNTVDGAPMAWDPAPLLKTA